VELLLATAWRGHWNLSLLFWILPDPGVPPSRVMSPSPIVLSVGVVVTGAMLVSLPPSLTCVSGSTDEMDRGICTYSWQPGVESTGVYGFKLYLLEPTFKFVVPLSLSVYATRCYKWHRALLRCKCSLFDLLSQACWPKTRKAVH
jgi:hypothetical protein